jgi:hypothetical protein
MRENRARVRRIFWIGFAFFIVWYIGLPIVLAGMTPAGFLVGIVMLAVFGAVLRWCPTWRGTALTIFICASIGLRMLTPWLMLWLIEEGYTANVSSAAALGLLGALIGGILAGAALIVIWRQLSGERKPEIDASLLSRMDTER